MSKKISKFLLTLLVIILTVSSFSLCFADEAVVTSETEEATTTSEEEITEEEIYSGDLYIFDNNVVMDKLVDGNVFIFGSNVEVTGQVNGNLFVFANTVSFNESYVRYSIFACASSVYYNGACNDLYVATNNLEMTYDSYVVRDLKTVSSNVILKAAIGRDVDLFCNTVDFGEGEVIPVIYGNLRYSANKEVEIPEGIINGDGNITYTKPTELEDNSVSTVSDILIGFATCILTVLIIYAITRKLTPNFNEKLSNIKLSVAGLLKSFGIGLASIIIVSIFFILLLMTVIGAKLSIILVLIYATLCLIAVPALTIVITNVLKPTLKIEKTSMFCLILALVSVILHGITLIPFVGGALGFIIKMIAIGLLINMYLSHKEVISEKQVTPAETEQQENEDVINAYKNENNIFSIVLAIILVILLVLIFNIPALISGYQIFTSSSDAADSALNASQEILEQTQSASEAAQEALNNIIKDTTN